MKGWARAWHRVSTLRVCHVRRSHRSHVQGEPQEQGQPISGICRVALTFLRPSWKKAVWQGGVPLGTGSVEGPGLDEGCCLLWGLVPTLEVWRKGGKGGSVWEEGKYREGLDPASSQAE